MINYRIDNRYHIIGAGMQSYGGMWPSTATANWWEAGGATGAVAVYQPKGAASYAASIINLINPATFVMSSGVAFDWATEVGWTGDDTKWIGCSDISIPITATVLARGTFTQSSRAIYSLGNGGSYQLVFMGSGVPTAFRVYNGNVYADIAAGLYVSVNHVYGQVGAQAYLDGSTLGAAITPSNTTNATRMAIGAWWPGYGPYNKMIGTIQAVAVYGGALSGDEVAAVSAAMAAL